MAQSAPLQRATPLDERQAHRCAASCGRQGADEACPVDIAGGCSGLNDAGRRGRREQRSAMRCAPCFLGATREHGPGLEQDCALRRGRTSLVDKCPLPSCVMAQATQDTQKRCAYTRSKIRNAVPSSVTTPQLVSTSTRLSPRPLVVSTASKMYRREIPLSFSPRGSACSRRFRTVSFFAEPW